MSRKHHIPHSRLEISLQESVRLQAELFLRRDPLTGKIAHGEWSAYVQRLITDDLNRKAHLGDIPDGLA